MSQLATISQAAVVIRLMDEAMAAHDMEYTPSCIWLRILTAKTAGFHPLAVASLAFNSSVKSKQTKID